MMVIESYLTRDDRECTCDGYMTKMSNRFNYGFALTIGRWEVAIPLPVLILFKVPIIASSAWYFTVAPDYVPALCSFLVFSAGLTITTWAFFMKGSIEELSRGIDAWQDYRLLREETEAMRHQITSIIDSASFYYCRGLAVGVILISNSYIPKLIMINNIKPEDILIFPCWSPFSFNTWAEAILVQIIQSIDIYFTSFIYQRIIFYFIGATLLIGKQVQLTGKAFTTMNSRVNDVLSSRAFKSYAKREVEFTREMIHEIKACALHFQNLIRCSKLLDESFTVIVDITIYFAMWLWCLFAVQLVTNDKKAFSTQGLTLLIESLGTSFLCSALVEAYVSNFEDSRNTVYFSGWQSMPLPCKKLVLLFQSMVIRSPRIRTSLGTHVNLENFSRAVNLAYCYFGFIVTMKTKEPAKL